MVVAALSKPLSVLLLLFSLFANPAMAANNNASAKKNADALIARFENGSAIWRAQDDGSVRHIQSGLVCPANFTVVTLWNLMVYDSPSGIGTDVGCDYWRSRIEGKGAETKIAIFAVKAAPGTTLDEAFQTYRKQMYASYPGAKSEGTALSIESDKPGTLPAIKSEEASIELYNRPYQTEIVVSLVNGWIIEVRSTHPSQYKVEKAGEAGDAALSALALFAAFASVGKNP